MGRHERTGGVRDYGNDEESWNNNLRRSLTKTVRTSLTRTNGSILTLLVMTDVRRVHVIYKATTAT
jgi:hypothetical protein